MIVNMFKSNYPPALDDDLLNQVFDAVGIERPVDFHTVMSDGFASFGRRCFSIIGELDYKT